MEKQQVRNQGKRCTMLNGVLALAVFGMMAGGVLGGGQLAQGANLGLLGVNDTYNVHTQTNLAAPISGVLVQVKDQDGVLTASAATNAAGDISFTLPDGFTGVVTPFKTAYEFTPTTKSIVLSNPSTSDIFVGAPSTRLVTVSGLIKVQGDGPLAGVTVTLTSPDMPSTSGVTNTSGIYSVNIPINATNVTVTPSLAGYTFAPASALLPPAASDLTQNFTVIVFKTISGQVRLGMAATTTVTISVTDTSGTVIVTTSGVASNTAPYNYSVTVQGPFSGYVKASAPNWSFLPFHRAYANLMINRTGQDFDGIAVPTAGLTDVYDIVYKPNGKGKPAVLDGTAGIKISSGSIIITGASDKDTLSVKVNKLTKKNAALMAALPAITSIQTSQGLAMLLSEARVDTLSAKGLLGKITTLNASIGKIKTDGGIGAIAMTDNKPSPVEVVTAIVAGGTNTKKASVKLAGIKLEVLITPETQAFTLVQLETKKSKVVGSRPAQYIVASSGFLGGAGASIDVKSPYDLQAGVVSSILAKGSVVQPAMMVAGIKKLAGTSLALNGKTYPADISVGLLYAKGQNAVITVAGGNIEPGLYLADGKITSFNATAKKLNGVFVGGLIGDPTTTTASIAPTSNALTVSGLVVACSGLNPISAAKTAKDMGTINGSTGVFGLFVAGGTPTMAGGLPVKVTPQGAIAKIGAVKTSKTGKGLVRLYGTAPKSIAPAITVKLGDAN